MAAVGAAAGSSTTEVFSKCVLEMGAEQGAKEISMGSLLKFSDEQGCSRQTKAKTPIRLFNFSAHNIEFLFRLDSYSVLFISLLADVLS